MEFQITGKELETASLWQNKHTAECSYMKKHADDPYRGIPAIGGRWWYKFIPTGLGTCVTVGCSFCGASADITDVELW